MTTVPPSLGQESCEWPTLTIATNDLTLGVVPALGGKILSLVDHASGIDWLWSPPDDRGLFRNAPGDPFARSTLRGADECFPTVAACHWHGRDLPDHGELWSVPWRLLARSADAVALEVRAPISPFVFRRGITVAGCSARFTYRVQNVGDSPEAFLWAFHPLLNFGPGDYLELPATSARIDSQINTSLGARGTAITLPEPVPGLRLDRMDFGPGGPAAVKFFTDSLGAGRVALARPALRRRLCFEFDRAQLNTVGVWINQGGWAGFRHVAIEPTNGAPDPLDVAAGWHRCQQVGAGAIVSWEMTLRFENIGPIPKEPTP